MQQNVEQRVSIFLPCFMCIKNAEEKKAVKRSYQKIHEDEDDDDDDYRSHVSPHSTNNSATQLVGMPSFVHLKMFFVACCWLACFYQITHLKMRGASSPKSFLLTIYLVFQFSSDSSDLFF